MDSEKEQTLISRFMDAAARSPDQQERLRSAEFQEPGSATEKAVAERFCTLLQKERARRNDHFFCTTIHPPDAHRLLNTGSLSYNAND